VHHLMINENTSFSRPQHSTALRRTEWSEHGMDMAWHDMCQSDSAALCKSNGKDIF